ncbi:MAG: hypothetical protein AAGJ40_02860 [Planctomycetota bacterium]
MCPSACDTAFSRQFSRTGAPLLMRQFGEDLVYWANGATAGRGIKAIVERDVDVIAETGEVTAHATVVRVQNHNRCGISSVEIDTGGDAVDVSLRIGEPATRRQIVQVLSTANSIVRFMVQ